MASSQCLAIGGGDTTAGRAAIQWTCGSGNEQKWAWDKGNRLHNVGTNQCLAVPNGSLATGVGLIQWPRGSGLEQQWGSA